MLNYLSLSTFAILLSLSDAANITNTIPYEINFDGRPSYIANNVVVLTFDDGPDWFNTEKVLNVLKDKNAFATFFINVNNWANLDNDKPMQDLVRRMVNEGHELASHSYSHPHLPTLSPADIDAQLIRVETSVQNIFGPNAPLLTMFRSPYGEPYQGNNPSLPSQGFQLVAPIVARHAVHIGWAIDSFDYNCAGSASCVVNNVKNALKTPGQGNYGEILMHSVHAQTAEALPEIIDYIRANGFVLGTTEQLIRAQFGRSSAELIYGGTNPTNPPATTTTLSPTTILPPIGCGGIPQYSEGVTYNASDRVQNHNRVYQCRIHPYTAWCSQGGPYTPGTGFAWDQAWLLIGPCQSKVFKVNDKNHKN